MYLKSIIFNLTRIIWNTTFGICFAIFMILLANDAFAQSTSSHFFGSLTDDSEEPVGFATIGLYRIDSSLVKGGLSDINGLFEFSDIKPDDYYIEIHSVEFEKYSETFTLNNQERLDLGTIQLSSSSLSLDEVVVTSERQLIEVRPDRMVYNVESNVNAQGINALELLNQAPGVLVDPSNNITLQGKSGVRVFINGRPSRLSGEDLANFLQSMSSDNIQRIELITNPSARYEAEGNAGIIDIRLKNNVTLGYNGTIISNYSLGKESRLTNGLTLNYGKGKVGVTANITRFDNRFSFATNSITEQNGNQLDLESDDLRYRRGYNIIRLSV